MSNQKVSQEWERDFTFCLIGASEAFGRGVTEWLLEGPERAAKAQCAAEWAEAMADAAADVRRRRKVEPAIALKSGLTPKIKPGETPSSDIPL